MENGLCIIIELSLVTMLFEKSIFIRQNKFIKWDKHLDGFIWDGRQNKWKWRCQSMDC